MLRSLIATLPPELGKWFALILVLLLPGSFFVLPFVWLAKHVPFRKGNGRPANMPDQPVA